MKNSLAIFSLFGISTGVLGFIYPPSRRIIVGVTILLCLSVVVNYVKEKRSLREILVLGFFVAPILICAFFYRFASDLVLSWIVMFFGSLFFLSALVAPSERQKRLTANIAFFGAFALALALNYHSLLELTHAQGGTTRQPSTDAPELAPFYQGDKFYYVGEFFLNYAYLMKDSGGNYFRKLPDGRCSADVHTAREETAIVFCDVKGSKFAVVEMQSPKIENLMLEELKFTPAASDNFIAKAWARASNPNDYKKDQKQGKRALWVFVDTIAESHELRSIYAEAGFHTEPKTGYKFFEIIGVVLERSNFTIDGRVRTFSTFLEDPLRVPIETPREMKMNDGDLASAVWRLYETHVIE